MAKQIKRSKMLQQSRDSIVQTVIMRHFVADSRDLLAAYKMQRSAWEQLRTKDKKSTDEPSRFLYVSLVTKIFNAVLNSGARRDKGHIQTVPLHIAVMNFIPALITALVVGTYVSFVDRLEFESDDKRTTHMMNAVGLLQLSYMQQVRSYLQRDTRKATILAVIKAVLKLPVVLLVGVPLLIWNTVVIQPLLLAHRENRYAAIIGFVLVLALLVVVSILSAGLIPALGAFLTLAVPILPTLAGWIGASGAAFSTALGVGAGASFLSGLVSYLAGVVVTIVVGAAVSWLASFPALCVAGIKSFAKAINPHSTLWQSAEGDFVKPPPKPKPKAALRLVRFDKKPDSPGRISTYGALARFDGSFRGSPQTAESVNLDSIESKSVATYKYNPPGQNAASEDAENKIDSDAENVQPHTFGK